MKNLRLYRFADKNFADDISGKGAYLSGGRWNKPGTYALYTSGSVSLALFEVLTRFSIDLIGDIFDLVTLEIPANIPIDEVQLKDLPTAWNGFPAPETVIDLGDKWLKERKGLVLKVPSALIPVESNYILNPLHKEFKKVKKIGRENFNIDKRIARSIIEASKK